MQPDQVKQRQDFYKDFLDFIRYDIQHERKMVHRRMFSVFFWCFILPAVSSISLLLLIKAGWVPRRARGYLDGMVLIFPVSYSLYVLGSEVLMQVPKTFRKGGISNTLGQALKESEWRERVCEAMIRKLPLGHEHWTWIVTSFRVDLQVIQYRTRYLTALAGAVFFLLMHGIDTLGDSGEPPVSWSTNPLMGWLENSTNDVSQLVGLALFLVLLYLSGNQTYHSLTRYLSCAELNLMAVRNRNKDR